MAKTASEVFQKIQQRLAQKLRELPPIIGNEAVNHSLDAFQQEGWDGEAWPKRKNPTKWGKADETDRALLVKTGKLKRSVRISEIGEGSVTIQAGGADVPYARAHNFGYKGTVTQNVNEHNRRTKKFGTARVRAHTRTISQNIPQRRFIGGEADSAILFTT